MKKETFQQTNDFVRAGVAMIRQTCDNTKERAFIALAGGTTPLPVYRALGESPDMDFASVDFFLVDERNVGLDSENSNYRAVMDQLGRHRGVRMHFFDTRLGIDEAIRAYQKELTLVPDGTFDLMILGIGTDGHIGSLFPHTAALRSTADIAHTATDAFPVRDRMTLTLSVIMRSKKLLLLAGPDKKDILDRMIFSAETVEDIPAKKLTEHPNITIHVLETA